MVSERRATDIIHLIEQRLPCNLFCFLDHSSYLVPLGENSTSFLIQHGDFHKLQIFTNIHLACCTKITFIVIHLICLESYTLFAAFSKDGMQNSQLHLRLLLEKVEVVVCARKQSNGFPS